MVATISDIGEDGLIEYIFNTIHESEFDDTITESLNGLAPNSLLVSNTDMLVSTTDVPEQMNLFQAGRKAIVMATSDLLVKGVKPSWASIALGLPRDLLFEGARGFSGLIQGLYEGCKEFGIRYRGGDLNTTKELIVSVSVTGYIDPIKYISRSGAKAGDYVYVNGEFGYTGVGLSLLLKNNINKSGLSEKFINKSIDSVLNARISGAEARYLSEKGYASASCDSSDGLHRTLQAIAKASGVGFQIHLDVFVKPELLTFSMNNQISLEKLIVGAGEEWIHVFCINPQCKDSLKNDLIDELQKHNSEKTPNSQFSLIEIGTCTNEGGVIRYYFKGKEMNIDQEALGYVHFK